VHHRLAAQRGHTGAGFFDSWGTLRTTALLNAIRAGRGLSELEDSVKAEIWDCVLRDPVDVIGIEAVGLDGEVDGTPIVPSNEASTKWSEYLAVAQGLAGQGAGLTRRLMWDDVVHDRSACQMYFRWNLWPRLQICAAAGVIHDLRLLVSPTGESLIHSYAPRLAMVEGWPSYRLKFLEKLGCTTRLAMVKARAILEAMMADSSHDDGIQSDPSTYWELSGVGADGRVEATMKRQGADLECIDDLSERLASAQEWHRQETRYSMCLATMLRKVLPLSTVNRVDTFLFGAWPVLSIDPPSEPLASDYSDDADAPVVLEDIDHDEIPAYIPAEEAAHIANQQWATRIESRIDDAAGTDSLELSRPTAHTRKCVLLEFNRYPKELEDALLMSSVADAARQRGVEVQPDWAHGAKVFVDGLQPDMVDAPLAHGELKPWHVIVYESDETELQHALQPLPYRVKKLKPGVGRSIVPQELSLMDVSSEGEHDIINDAGLVIEYVVKNTFLELVEAQPIVWSSQSV